MSEQQTKEVFSLRVIQQTGVINLTKLLKLLMITYQAIIIDFLPVRYNEALLKKIRLTKEENESVIKKLKI